MREIKFRAWSENRKTMFFSEQVYICKGQACIQTIKGGDFDPENVDLMQFTGLKDENGVEIYEGDIMKTDSGANMSVSYREDMAMFVCRLSHGGSCSIEIAWEVIGNIYQNPELLK